MPLEGAVIATLAGLLAGGRPATARPVFQNSSTAAAIASTLSNGAPVSPAQAFLPVHDSSGFQQHGRHMRGVKHDQVIVTINAGFLID